MFLALGLSALIAFEMLLISGGVLGAIPLSGVVSPFLSFGNTAMLANFPDLRDSGGDFESRERTAWWSPNRSGGQFVRLEWVLGAAAAALAGFAAYYQVARDQDFLAREAKVFEDDGVKRPQRNPRLNSLAREIRRGNIFDRNGVLLATSDWNELEQRRDQYLKLGVSIEACLFAAGQPALSVRSADGASFGRSAHRREFPRDECVADRARFQRQSCKGSAIIVSWLR